MLIQSGIDFNIPFAVMDPDPAAPCAGMTEFHCGNLTDYDTVIAFGSRCDVITIEIAVGVITAAPIPWIARAAIPHACGELPGTDDPVEVLTEAEDVEHAAEHVTIVRTRWRGLSVW